MRTLVLSIIPVVFKSVSQLYTLKNALFLGIGVGERFCFDCSFCLCACVHIEKSKDIMKLQLRPEQPFDIITQNAWHPKHQSSIRLDFEVWATQDNTFSLIPSLLIQAGSRDSSLISFIILFYSCSSSGSFMALLSFLGTLLSPVRR